MSRDIPLDQVKPNPNQPRKHFDEGAFTDLGENIKQHGQLTPGLVRPIEDGFEIVHGERRWRACKLAGLETFRADMRELDDAQAFTLSLVENVQRDDLTSIEQAKAARHF